MAESLTNSIILMLVIMLSINVGLTFTQSAIDDLNHVSVLNTSNSPLSNYHTGSLTNGTSLVTSSYLPSGEAITEDTGTVFTDSYIVLKSFVSSGLDTLGFLVNILNQPAGFLKDVGVPSAISLSLQIIWSMMFIFLITAWIMGR
jgi:hypothetical protein